MKRENLLVNEENYPMVSSESVNYQDLNVDYCVETDAVVIIHKLENTHLVERRVIFTDYVAVDYFGTNVILRGNKVKNALLMIKFQMEFYDFIIEIRDKDNKPLYIFTLNEIKHWGLNSSRDVSLIGNIFRTKYRKLNPIDDIILIEDILRKHYHLNAMVIYESIYGVRNLIVRVHDAIDLGEVLTEEEELAMKLMKFKRISDEFILIDLNYFTTNRGREFNYHVSYNVNNYPNKFILLMDYFNQSRCGFAWMELIASDGEYHRYRVTGVNENVIDGSIVLGGLHGISEASDIYGLNYSEEANEVEFTLRVIEPRRIKKWQC